MALESASFISGLVSANPPGTDAISQGDDHLRLIKTVLKASLPNADEAINGIHTRGTEPSSTSAGQLWFDTTLNLVKIRNEANNAWIILLASEGARVLEVTHKTDSSSNRPADDDDYENTGMFVTHTKISDTSNLYVQFDCYVNVSVDWSAPASATVTGYLGNGTASTSAGKTPLNPIISGTSARVQILIEDPIGTSGTWDWTNTFSRVYKVTAANCPAGSGSVGAQVFTWVNKMSDISEMIQVLAVSWMVWEVEE